MFLPQPEVQISIKCHTYTRINDRSRTCTCTHTLTNVAFYYSHSLLKCSGFFIIFLFTYKLKYVHLIRKLIIVTNK